MRHVLSRLSRMSGAELTWRATAAAHIAFDRARAAIHPPRWRRRDLRALLAPLPELAAVRASLAAGRWDQAQRDLAQHFANAPARFVISARMKGSIVDRIRREFPGSAHEAAARSDRILAGQYDLLGYRGLQFDSIADATQRTQRTQRKDDPSCPSCFASAASVDWHLDPVHHRRAPQTFWSSVPYLDPACGDHKIIWELNRHQHWLVLGRAYWLTSDVRYRERALAELASWLSANPPLVGINWASMLEIAFRSMSWIWALQFFVAGHESESPWIVDLLLALDRQLTHIERNLSYYFSPNTHLLGEALALYVAGQALPELAASGRRARLGRRILVAEIDRQIAADGGHCERSAHYHRYTLDFYLLALAIARLTGDCAAAAFERAAGRLASAARLVADDNGRLPHIGDDDAGSLMPMTGREPDDARGSLAIAAAALNRPDLAVSPPAEEVLWMLGETPAFQIPTSKFQIPSGALPETGYYVSRSANGVHIVIDGGPHGYQNGGHAHADALSLTLAVRGVPLLIDPGTGGYTTDRELRDRLRSSAMHNTLMVDGRPQSVPNGPFHWKRTADAHVQRWHAGDTFDYFDGWHDGYVPIVHRRRVLALHGAVVVVADFVDARSEPSTNHTAAVHWHVDPRWTVEVAGRRVTFTRSGANAVALMVPHGLVESFTADEETGLGWASPAYGRIEPATTVRVSHQAGGPFWMASVFALGEANPIVDVEWAPVSAEPGVVAHAAALRITRADSTDYVVFAEPRGGHAGPPLHGVGADLSVGPTWCAAEIESDARMLYWRVGRDRRSTWLAMVDGSFIRFANEIAATNGQSPQASPQAIQASEAPAAVASADARATRAGVGPREHKKKLQALGMEPQHTIARLSGKS